MRAGSSGSCRCAWGGWPRHRTGSCAALRSSWPTTSPRCRPPASRPWSAATPTWATSASTPRPSATSSSTSTTSTRRTRARGSGTCAGSWPASGWRAGRTGRRRTRAPTPCSRAAPRTARRSRTWPTSRCSRGPSSGWTSTGSASTRRTPHWRRRSSARCAEHARAPATACSRGSPRSARGAAGSSRSRRCSPGCPSPRPRWSPRVWTRTCTRSPRTGSACWVATRWWTSRTRSSASARWGCVPTSPCSRAPARTTSSSSSSSRHDARCSPRTCTATTRGTPTRASASWSTSRRCRRSATRCWAGPRSTAGSSTCASSAT